MSKGKAWDKKLQEEIERLQKSPEDRVKLITLANKLYHHQEIVMKLITEEK